MEHMTTSETNRFTFCRAQVSSVQSGKIDSCNDHVIMKAEINSLADINLIDQHSNSRCQGTFQFLNS